MYFLSKSNTKLYSLFIHCRREFDSLTIALLYFQKSEMITTRTLGCRFGLELRLLVMSALSTGARFDAVHPLFVRRRQ